MRLDVLYLCRPEEHPHIYEIIVTCTENIFQSKLVQTNNFSCNFYNLYFVFLITFLLIRVPQLPSELHDVADMQLKNLLPLERSRANVAAALIAAPPFIILDEYVACQKFSVRRGLYHILNHLRKRGHGILLSASK